MKEFEIAEKFKNLKNVEAVCVSEDGETYSLISKEYLRIKMTKAQATQFAKSNADLCEIKKHFKE